MSTKRALVAIPTYNESGNVEPLAQRILALKLDADVMFIDDNSPDGTGKILDRIAAEHPQIQVMHRPGKQGIGSAHRAPSSTPTPKATRCS